MAITITIRALIMAAAVFHMAAAADYTVGAPGGGWDLQTNYTSWVLNKIFHPGDRLRFQYSPAAHDVLEVNKGAYDSCSLSNPISTHRSGNDFFPLDATGTRYFICGVGNHCNEGMKIKIDIVQGSSPSPAPAGAPGSNSPPPPPPRSDATSSVAAAAGFGLAAVLGSALMLIA